ncbi:hypothetical protein [Streptomyces sp. NPDC056948]|uniref:hypothetical protein n=1 Tax=Streptomyces sp. NPDC056948 TaxID=3345975 RepID=UPI003633C7F6
MPGIAKMLQANNTAFPEAAGAAADKALGKSDLTSLTHEKFGTGEKPYNAAYSDWKTNTLKPASDTHW